jgi:protein involved in polysaccharide export with SLBB domain
MRSCLHLFGAFCALFTVAASAQNVIPNNNRSAAPAAVTPLPSASEVSATGKIVSADSKLIPNDIVTVQIEEDREAPWKTAITDTGEVDLNILGSVRVAGKTTAEAEVIVGAYLRQKYYHRATVSMKIVSKAQGYVRPDKVTVAGKIQRAGPQYFNDANPLKLSEAVIVAGTTVFSNLSNVQLTRNGQNTIYDVEAITKKGRTDLDVKLQNGDQIFVREKNWVFGTN